MIIMKRNVPGLLGVGCAVMGLMGWAAWAETAQPLPTPFPEVRYQQMSAKSPFAVATAAAADANAAPTPGFAAQLYIDGVAHVGDRDFVAIKTRNPEDGKPAVVVVESGTTTEDGIKVERVEWSPEMGKTTVDVSKDGEKATLAFDEQTVKSAPAVSNPMGQPGVQLPRIPGQVRQGNFPTSGPFQQPGALFNRIRAFPQPQPNNMAGPPNGAGGVAPGVDIRRRVRVIQSGQ